MSGLPPGTGERREPFAVVPAGHGVEFQASWAGPTAGEVVALEALRSCAGAMTGEGRIVVRADELPALAQLVSRASCEITWHEARRARGL